MCTQHMKSVVCFEVNKLPWNRTVRQGNVYKSKSVGMITMWNAEIMKSSVI